VSAPLELRGLRVTRGSLEILRGVDLQVEPGEVCALMGVSGAGKTTVLRAIAALQPFEAGTVRVGAASLQPGRIPPEARLRAWRRVVGMVFQANALFEHLTVLENVTLAPMHALGWTRERAEGVARSLLDTLGVLARAAALPRELSGGEAQRVAIARALAPDPPLLLMDEPTSALDPARRGSLGEVLRTLAGTGRALMISTHDADFARVHADRVAVLSHGLVVEHGAAPDVLSRSQHEATQALLRRPQ
jgi:ABC-type polar amino acid transport system ATPase subunit